MNFTRGMLSSITLLAASYSSLFAQETPAAPSPGGGITSILPMMVIMFIIIYFFMIRPEQKKQKERTELLKNLKKGDKVLTAGGIIGIVGNVKDNSVTVKIADNTVVEFTKSAVTTVLKSDETLEKSVDNKEEKKK